LRSFTGGAEDPRVRAWTLRRLAAAGLAAGVAALTACSSPPPSALERVRRAGVLRWGADRQGGEPYVYEDPSHPGRLVGFEVELAEALARALGVRAEMIQNDWSTLIPSLERGTFDIVMNGLEVTPARAARVAFTRPYFLFSERLSARAGDARVRDLASLRGLRVGTLANSQAWTMLLEAGAVAVPYEGVDEPFIDLERGRTDAVLLDDIIVDRYAPRHPGVRVVGDVGEGSYAIAVRRGEADLLDALDAALARIAGDGELGRILGRYHLGGPRQDRLAAAAAAPLPPGTAPARWSPRQTLLFLEGAAATLAISTGAMALAVLLGLGLALARLSSARGRWAVAAYVELFRGTPVLLQLYVIYYGLAGVLRLSAWGAAILGLGLNYAAYEAEIYRAGLTAVPVGQMEAALALGMSRRLALRRIVVPQALRFALPGMTNDFISLLKDSSLVSVITVVELTKRMTIAAVDMRSWLGAGALCAALYFAMSYPLARLARRLERKLGPRPALDHPPRT
jgi:polar amino acid transport system substrate-binding protein